MKKFILILFLGISVFSYCQKGMLFPGWTKAMLFSGGVKGFRSNIQSVTDPNLLYHLTDSTHFDGTESIAIPDLTLNSLDSFTVVTWVYPEAFESYRTIWSNDNSSAGCNGEGCYFIVDAGYAIAFRVDSKTMTFIEIDNPLENAWYQIAVTLSDEYRRIYLDGSKIQETATASAVANGDLGFVLGDYNGCATNTHWLGAINEVRVYDRTLSDTEINDLYTEDYSKFY